MKVAEGPLADADGEQAISEPALELIVVGIGRDLGLPDALRRTKGGDRILGRSDLAVDLSNATIGGRQTAAEGWVAAPFADESLVVLGKAFSSNSRRSPQISTESCSLSRVFSLTWVI